MTYVPYKCPVFNQWPLCSVSLRSAPVSYTHLDVYKRQQEDVDEAAKALTKAMADLRKKADKSELEELL